MEPTPEQKRIINAKGNIVVTARPGSGKTYTIVKIIEKVLDNCDDYKGVIAISFTKKASRELEMRCKKTGIIKKSSFFGTIDNFYITEIIIPFAKHLFDKNIDFQIEQSINVFSEFTGLKYISNGLTSDIEKLLLSSLEHGYIFLEISGETAFYILNKVLQAKEYIKSRYTHVFIDEYQDCGEIQHKIFIKLVEMGLIGIAVGDLDQAIYAFTNRYSKYLELLLKNKDFSKFSLSRNHRCHDSIVRYSLQLLGIKQEIPPKKDMRVFKVKCCGNEVNIAKRISEKINNIKENYMVEKNSNIGVLCRSNGSAKKISENLSVKNKLFIDNIMDKSHYQWSRFFSDLLRDYFDKEVFPIDVASKYVDEELDRNSFIKILKILNELFETPEDSLKDRVGLFEKLAYLILPEYKKNEPIVELRQVLNDTDLLNGYRSADDDEICIMTLHKSKGLEFDVVFHMDLYDWVFPKRDISEDEYVQDINLHYVGVTRAKKVCYIMQGEKRYRAYRDDFIDAYESPFLYINNLNEYRRNISWANQDN